MKYSTCSNSDGPGDCHTDRHKSEKEKHRIISLMGRIYNEMIQMNLFTKQKHTHRLREELTVIRWGKDGGRDSKETGMYMYILLYFKWIVNKHLLYSSKTVQCYAVTWMGGESGEGWIHV